MAVLDLPVSERQVTAAPPDLFDLALRGDVPNIVLSGVQRLILAALVGTGMATAEERAIVEREPDGEAAVAMMRYLIEEGTTEPKLCSTLERAQELKAQGVAVDLQARYTQIDLFYVYDAILGRGGAMFSAIFPEFTDGAGESPTPPVESVADAAVGPDGERDAAMQPERDLASVAA